ncbi:MAG: tetratricopeptide repeat protein [Candidatus Micrarchaeota archaeon]|nr:tetratricopeptide repeat protein [Candidatus Micrarchaeota archaeon]
METLIERHTESKAHDGNERQNDFISTGLTRKPLVCLWLLDFENVVMKLPMEKVVQAKKKYTDFVESALLILKKEGFEEPKNEKEAKALCLEICKILWGKFEFELTELTLRGLTAQPRDKKKIGQMDCDTSSFMVADILNQFGVKSRLVTVPGHALLHIKSGGIDFYQETLEQSKFATHKNKDALVKAYGAYYGECDFGEGMAIAYSNRGTMRLNRDDFKGGLSDLNAALDQNLMDAESYVWRGSIWHHLKDYKKVVEDDTKALQINPRLTKAYLDRSYAKFVLNDLAGAIADSDSAIKINRYADIAYSLRGSYKCMSGDYEGAREDLLKAELTISPFSIAREQTESYFKLKDYFDGRIRLDPKNARLYLVRGYALYRLGHLDEAIKNFDETIKLGLNDNLAYILRGNAKANLGDWYGAQVDYVGAMKDYNKAIELSPKDAEAYNARGIFLCKMHMNSQALTDINKAISIDQSRPSFYYSRALLYMQINNGIGALMDLSMALKLDPTLIHAINARKELLKKTKPQPGGAQ